MRSFVVGASLALIVGAAPIFAQTPAQAATQEPTGPTPPVQPTTPTQPAPTPPPFPQGAKVAYVNLQGVFQLSVEGKAAGTKLEALTQQKQAQIGDKQKALQAAQQKLQTSSGVMSDEARAELGKNIERQSVELERLQQDAQTDVADLQQDLNNAFQKRLAPILEGIAKENGLQMLFSAGDAGLIWAEAGLDLTVEAVKRLDSGTAK